MKIKLQNHLKIKKLLRNQSKFKLLIIAGAISLLSIAGVTALVINENAKDQQIISNAPSQQLPEEKVQKAEVTTDASARSSESSNSTDVDTNQAAPTSNPAPKAVAKAVTPTKTSSSSTVQTPAQLTPTPDLTTINVTSYEAPNTSDINYYRDYAISYWPNVGASSPEGYILKWNVDYAPNLNGQQTSSNTSTGTFKLAVRLGYTYNVTVCQNKAGTCGVTSAVIKIKAPQ